MTETGRNENAFHHINIINSTYIYIYLQTLGGFALWYSNHGLPENPSPFLVTDVYFPQL